jgi:glycosyltransferase involved in cell wall biosynthesis
MSPLVSIIITNYNLGKYLYSAINSLLKQDYEGPIEIIIIDDFSNDDSRNIIEGFVDKRIIKIYNNENLGARESIELGFSLAKGDFICRFDADDFWDKSFISQCLRVFDRSNEVAFVYTDVFFIDCNTNIYGFNGMNINRPNGKEGFLNNEFFHVLKNYYICAPGIMAKREAWMLGLPIPNELYAVDWYLSCAILQNHKAYFIDKKLAYYRVHEQNMHTEVVRSGHEIKIFEIINNHFIQGNGALNIFQKRYLISVNTFNIAIKLYGIKNFCRSIDMFLNSLKSFSSLHLTFLFYKAFFKCIYRLVTYEEKERI